MSAFKMPRRLPVRPRTEPVEREEYVDVAAPYAPVVRRSFAPMPTPVRAMPAGHVDDDDDAAIAAMTDDEYGAWADTEGLPDFMREGWRAAARRAVRNAHATDTPNP